MRSRRWIIAIDGPAAAGKSTVAKRIAKKLRIRYIDSGAIYRAITWKGLEEKIDLNDKEAVVELTKRIKIELKTQKRVFVDNKEITKEIRKPIIDQNISVVAKNEGVRQQVVKLLQELSKTGGVIMEGRDITTVVLPHADVKFYLDAEVKCRANRRYKELLKRGEKNIDFAQVQQEIEYRDMQDKTRTTGPLVQTEDAIYIDTTNMKIKEVVNTIIKEIRNIQKADPQGKLYSVLHLIGKPLFKILFNFKVSGEENIPSAGGALLAANHTSYIDPVVIGAALRRQCYYIAKQELFNYSFLGWLIRKLNAISIGKTGISIQTFRKIIELLEKGSLVVLFPEGQRSFNGKLQPPKSGVGMIMCKVIERCPKVKLIPVKIVGAHEVLPRDAKWIRCHKVEVKFGKPIDINQFIHLSAKEKYQAIADTVMKEIENL